MAVVAFKLDGEFVGYVPIPLDDDSYVITADTVMVEHGGDRRPSDHLFKPRVPLLRMSPDAIQPLPPDE